ncbi:MAG: hypothetical protein ABIR71_00245 [Chthoniobacterales bacterium]
MRAWRTILISALLPLALGAARAEESDGEVEARKVALDLAGAFANDGFKLRDGHWSGPINQGEQALVAVNLYAGNQYWFSVGASEAAKKVKVQIYDEEGKPITTDEYAEENQAAAGFSPSLSGQYFVGIRPEESAAAYCLVYSYK